MNDKTPPAAEETRKARADMGDDLILPFTVDSLDIRGRVAHLGKAVHEAIRRHDYPDSVSRLLARMMALAALLGTTLKFQGKLIAQTQSDGPVRMLVADFHAPGHIRGLARFEPEQVEALEREGKADEATLLGSGQLVFTLDQGAHMQRYQGLVRLDGDLEKAAEEYFAQSEQIPTRIRLAGDKVNHAGEPQWRAGALLIQHLPPAGQSGESEEDRQARKQRNDDNWATAVALFDTLTEEELLDPALSPERLAYRLFHEQGVRVFEPVPISWQCTCSRDGLMEVLRQFSKEEREEMLEDGKITATCQFCSTAYEFTPEELDQSRH
jgi:molecular chaperone Hsp33